MNIDPVGLFIEDCKKHGLNVTYQRLAVFKVISKHKGHPSAEDIYREVLKEYPRISLATIYTTLETLSKYSIISKVTPLHDTARYDYDQEVHHHLICINCRKIIDIKYDEFDYLWLPDDLKQNFKVLNYKIQFEGICPQCQSKSNQQQET